MELDLASGRFAISLETPITEMILLDTNAIIWLHRRDRRVRAFEKTSTRFYASPASLLELQMLIEAGRLRLRSGATIESLMADSRWLLDDPPSADWFTHTARIGWTREPFDRLIVAHAELRGWRLATGDAALISKLGAQKSLAL